MNFKLKSGNRIQRWKTSKSVHFELYILCELVIRIYTTVDIIKIYSADEWIYIN